MSSGRDLSLAHALGRVALGANIALHGFTRLPDLAGFAASLKEQFAGSILPAAIVSASGYGIAIAEAIIGTLLVLGLFLRPTLLAGAWLMIYLLVGVCLIQNWNVAGIQMTYIAFYAALLAFARYDQFSLDALRRNHQARPHPVLDHVLVAAPPDSTEVAREFYGGILGLEEIDVPAPLRDRACAWFRLGNLALHLGKDPNFQPARKAHPAIAVNDLSGLRQRLAARGFPIRDDEARPGVKRFFTEDPWGNRLEILERLS